MKTNDPRIRQFLNLTSRVRTQINHNKLFIDPKISKGASQNYIDSTKIRDSTQRKQLNQIINQDELIGYQGLGRKARFNPTVVDESVLRKYHYHQFKSRYENLINQNSVTLLLNDKSPFQTDINYRNFLASQIKSLAPLTITEDIDPTILTPLLNHHPTLRSKIHHIRKLKLKCLFISKLEIQHLLPVLQTIKQNLNDKHYELFGIYLNLSHSSTLSHEILEILNSQDISSPATPNTEESINYETLLKKAIQSHKAEDAEGSDTQKLLTLLGEGGFLNVDVSGKSISFIKGE